MLTALYIVLALAFGYLTWQAIGVYTSKRSSYALLLLIVLAGIAYDVLTILLGRWIGEGDLLKSLNAGRFIAHALVTPAMMVFGIGVLRKAGVQWAQSKTAHILVCVAATLLILLGLYDDAFALDLHTRTVLDTLRYVNEGGLKGPPIPSILTIVFLIAAGVSLWRSARWWQLAAGALLMFIAAGAGMGETFYISNIGELMLGLGSVLTARKFLS
jgi:hypothetical protein